MKYAAIKYFDIANGTGVRTTLFVSGCTHHCKGCFQPETWSFDFGEEFTQETERQIMESLEPNYIAGLAVLGGEPMEPQNQRALAPFLQRVKRAYPEKTIWLYTGDTLEDLLDSASSRHTECTLVLLSCLDVMVDGLFVQELKDITLRFRGSSNQRLLDIPKSLETGSAVSWEDEEVYSTHTM